MKYIIAPNPVVLQTSPEHGEPVVIKFIVDARTGMRRECIPVTMYAYLTSYPLHDKKFSAPFMAIMAGSAIMEAFRGKTLKDGPIPIEDAHYEILKAAVDMPEQVAGDPLTPELARQYRPFMEAIMNAGDNPAEAMKKAGLTKAALVANDEAEAPDSKPKAKRKKS